MLLQGSCCASGSCELSYKRLTTLIEIFDTSCEGAFSWDIGAPSDLQEQSKWPLDSLAKEHCDFATEKF